MKFRLKLLWFELEIDTPAVEQVSTIDIITAVIGVLQQNMPERIVLIAEDETEN